MNKKPVFYLQWDSRWANIPYTIDGDILTETIGKSGCGPSSVAMILSSWINKDITPVETCKMALEFHDRTACNGTSWTFFKHVADKYKLKYLQTESTNTAVNALKNGAYIVCSMVKGYFTKHGHFILAWNVDSQNIYVNDPNNQTKTKAAIDLFKEQCVQYFIYYPPAGVHIEEYDVVKLQELLTKLCHYKGKIDGIEGAQTIAAIKDFEKRNGLEVTGKVSGATLAKLKGFGL